MSAGWLRACALVMLGLFSVSALAKDKTAIVIGGGLSGLNLRLQPLLHDL